MLIYIKFLRMEKKFIEGWAVRGPFELHYFLYEIEFWSGNLFDTLPSVKKRETVDHYLSRLTPNQYLRYVKHQYFVCQRLATMGSVASLKDYRPKDKKILQSFIKTLARMEVFWKELYTEASFKKLKGYE